MIIPIFTPHGGCPERCKFCDQKTSGGQPVAPKDITDTIERFVAGDTHATEIAFYGGTFTAMPEARQLSYLEAVKPYLQTGQIERVRIATRPDALSRQWLIRLRDEYRLQTVELGVQSFEPRVLNNLGRSHSNKSVELGVALLKELGLTVGLHLMIGTPGEASDADQLTLKWLMHLRPDLVRIHPLLVIKGTELEPLWKSGAFVPPALEEMIERAATLTETLEDSSIRVIRLGLQSNELLGLNVVAGAYHPSFGDLVRGRIYRNQVSRLIERLSPRAGQIVTIAAPQSVLASLPGASHANLNWLKERFKLAQVRIEVGPKLDVC